MKYERNVFKRISTSKNRKMKIIPISWDSFSVRSTATFVETKNKNIFIDPGIAVGPRRYGLGPSQAEMEALERGYEEIQAFLSKTSIITISHYHYDHYISNGEGYEDKVLLIKHPKQNINHSQKTRAKTFLGYIEKKANVNFMDGKKYDEFGIECSPAVFHGEEGSKLGYVVMVSIEDGKEKLIHASDVQGPGNDESKSWIIDQNPTILMLSGYPSIFIGWIKTKIEMEKAFKRLEEIIEKTRVKKIVLDHHIARDLKYESIICDIKEKGGERGCWIGSAAEFIGKKPRFLEARRKELWKEENKT